MLIDRTIRDFREPRDWQHPWRASPGFFRGNKCDCHCATSAPSSVSTVGCAAACCDNFPRVLHLNIGAQTGGGHCVGIENKTVALTFSAQNCSWNGDLSCGTGGPPVGIPTADGINHFMLNCQFVAGLGRFGWVLRSAFAYCANLNTFNGFKFGSQAVEVSHTCSPVNISFTQMLSTSSDQFCLCDTCVHLVNQNWPAVITL